MSKNKPITAKQKAMIAMIAEIKARLKHQGKSKQQVENNYTILEWIIIGLGGLLIISYIIY